MPQTREMNDEPVFLTVDDVLALHVDQIREFGGSEGLRDQSGLEPWRDDD
jgi:hypothetical protein